ncbi:hypothetical protein C0995_004789, partial [Termitomyces sp. Mi166
MAGTGNSTPQAGDAGVIPLRPSQATPLRTEKVRDYKSAVYLSQYQASIPEWSGRGNVTASEAPQARYAPQEGKSLATGLEDQLAQESSDEEENNRSKLTLSVQLKLVLNCFPAVTKESTQKCLQLYVLKHMQMLANMGQCVPEVELTEYIELYLQIFELEIEEYMKRKEA